MRKHYLHCLILACTVGIFLTGCDQSSQNVDYDVADDLNVKGPDELTIPNYDSTVTESFLIGAFTIEKDYTWSVGGVINRDETRRDGEELVVSTSTPGSYTVSVSTNVDGQERTGSVNGVADYPPATEQASKYNMTVFSSIGQSAGLLSELRGGLTVFGPSNGAFYDVFDANGDSSLSAQELPSASILGSVLRYHAALDSLTSTEIANVNQPVATGLNGTFNGTDWSVPVTFSVSGGITVNGTESSADVVAADIGTDEDAVLHKVDNVLLPSALVAINDQPVDRDTVANVDSVLVEGAFVHDGGFIALHEGSASGAIIGNSDRLDGSTAGDPSGGFHKSIKIELDTQLSDTTTVVAMPHRDNAPTGLWDPSTDPPYTRGSTSIPVIDTADVATP